MANLSYDETYKKLQEKGRDDTRIKNALSELGMEGGEEVETNDTPNVIGVYQNKNGEEKTYDEIQADEGENAFNDLTGFSSVDDNESKSPNTSAVVGGSAALANTLAAAIQKKGWKAFMKGLKKAGKKGLKALKLTGKAGLKLLGKAASVAGLTYDEIQALTNERKDIEEGNIGNTGSGIKDSLQGAAYNVDKALLFDALPDKWYYNKGEDKENAKEAAQKNKDVMDTYKKLGGNYASNLGLEFLEGGYLKAEKKIKKKYGDKIAQEADNQLTKLGALAGFNQTDFRKQVIDKGYEFKKMKNKNGDVIYTWVNKDGVPLQNDEAFKKSKNK